MIPWAGVDVSLPAGPAIPPQLIFRGGIALVAIVVILLVVWVIKAIITDPTPVTGRATTSTSAPVQMTTDSTVTLIALDTVRVKVVQDSDNKELFQGTLARGQTQAARKRWIGLTARPRGHYVVDVGASQALVSGKRSLLAIGIVDVVGEFGKGDVVGIRDPDGREFARGLSNYSTAEARSIRGLRNEQVRQLLGTHYDEAIHKDNRALTNRPRIPWHRPRRRWAGPPSARPANLATTPSRIAWIQCVLRAGRSD